MKKYSNKGFVPITAILGIVLVLGAGGTTAMISTTGLVNIPVFSDIFYQKKISDLGIQGNPEAAEKFSQEIGFTPKGLFLRPNPLEPRIIEITDVGLTSWINERMKEVCTPKLRCTAENFQIKFEQGRYITSIRILEPTEVNVTIFGKIFRKDEKSIRLEFEKVYVGNLRIFFTEDKLSRAIEEQINRNLKMVENLKINRIEIFDGKAIFEGVLPPELIDLNLLDFIPKELSGLPI